MRKRKHPFRRYLGLPLVALALAAASMASAQWAPPVERVRQALPVPARVHELPSRLPHAPPLPQAVDNAANGVLRSAPTRLEFRRLVRAHHTVIDTDRTGAPVVRSEIVAIDPSAESLQRAQAAGFTIARESMLDDLGLRVVILRARDGVGTRAALRRIQRLDPDGQYEYNHLYLGSASNSGGGQALAPATVARAAGTPGRIGLVDSGVDGSHPALAGVELRTWGCGGRSRPDHHGTAVASLLAGDTGNGTTAPTRAILFAADIYCGQPAGGTATGLAEAMAWLAGERVGVVNLSLVGPHNRLLERAVRAMHGRGHVLVAAVGNDGPAAPPLFPAAYPEVIGVTAVDARLNVLPEAGRGPQVDFAAPGADLRVAMPGGGWTAARGTSFAAPIVARLAAQLMPAASSERNEAVRSALAAQARNLGSPGRDHTFGHGLLGTAPGVAQADPPQ